VITSLYVSFGVYYMIIPLYMSFGVYYMIIPLYMSVIHKLSELTKLRHEHSDMEGNSNVILQFLQSIRAWRKYDQVTNATQ
jgi:hypothetical protein